MKRQYAHFQVRSLEVKQSVFSHKFTWCGWCSTRKPRQKSLFLFLYLIQLHKRIYLSSIYNISSLQMFKCFVSKWDKCHMWMRFDRRSKWMNVSDQRKWISIQWESSRACGSPISAIGLPWADGTSAGLRSTRGTETRKQVRGTKCEVRRVSAHSNRFQIACLSKSYTFTLVSSQRGQTGWIQDEMIFKSVTIGVPRVCYNITVHDAWSNDQIVNTGLIIANTFVCTEKS